MAANVETMFYTRKKTWSGLRAKEGEIPESAEALKMPEFNWQVLQKPIYIFPVHIMTF